MSESELETLKETHLANWLQYYVKTSTTPNEFPTWFEELVGGPLTQAMSFPMYFTRGYLFQKRRIANTRTTVNHGVLVKADPVEYYGEIVDILQIEYPGLINLKCVAFKCEWYDPTEGRGIRRTKFGVTQINSSKRLNRYDPFVLASQADQVCYIPIPKIKYRQDPWMIATQINPRNRVDGIVEQSPLQQDGVDIIQSIGHSESGINLVTTEGEDTENLEVDNEDEDVEDEFHESESSESDVDEYEIQI